MKIEFSEISIFDSHLWPILLWGLVWLYVLYGLLTRSDVDTQTKILWTIVLIFVPFFGVFMYWFAAPGAAPAVRKTPPANDVAGTPWARDPGHIAEK